MIPTILLLNLRFPVDSSIFFNLANQNALLAVTAMLNFQSALKAKWTIGIWKLSKLCKMFNSVLLFTCLNTNKETKWGIGTKIRKFISETEIWICYNIFNFRLKQKSYSDSVCPKLQQLMTWHTVKECIIYLKRIKNKNLFSAIFHCKSALKYHESIECIYFL